MRSNFGDFGEEVRDLVIEQETCETYSLVQEQEVSRKFTDIIRHYESKCGLASIHLQARLLRSIAPLTNNYCSAQYNVATHFSRRLVMLGAIS